MWSNPQFPVDLVTFTKEIINEKLHFFVQWFNGVFLGIWKIFQVSCFMKDKWIAATSGILISKYIHRKMFASLQIFLTNHCVKSIQFRSFQQNTEFFLVRIFLYSVRIQENTDQKKLRIWTIFTQWISLFFLFEKNFRVVNSLRLTFTKFWSIRPLRCQLHTIMKVIIYFLYIVIFLFHIIFPWFIYILTCNLLVFPLVCLFVGYKCSEYSYNLHLYPEKDTVTIAFLWILNNFSEQLLNWLIFQLFWLFGKINRQDMRYVSFMYLLCKYLVTRENQFMRLFLSLFFFSQNQINRKKIDT